MKTYHIPFWYQYSGSRVVYVTCGVFTHHISFVINILYARGVVNHIHTVILKIIMTAVIVHVYYLLSQYEQVTEMC